MVGTKLEREKIMSKIKINPCNKCGSTDIEIYDCGYSSFNCGHSKCRNCGVQYNINNNDGWNDVAKSWNSNNPTLHKAMKNYDKEVERLRKRIVEVIEEKKHVMELKLGKDKIEDKNMKAEDLEPREIFERIEILMHSDISGELGSVIENIDRHYIDMQKNKPEYYKLETRLGYDCDNRAQFEIYGRRKETPQEMLKRLDRIKDSAERELDEECQADIDAFDRLKEKHPEMFVEHAEDFVKETLNTAGCTGQCQYEVSCENCENKGE